MFKKIVLNRIFGSIFLITGTSVGAGMLGLPIKLLGISFYFNLLFFIFFWFIMFISSIAVLEISFWARNNSNIVGISKNVLGNNFARLLICFYILFFYSLISAYISGGSTMLIELFVVKNNLYEYYFLIKVIFILPFCLIMFYGIGIIDYVNRILVCFLIISYFFLCFNIFKYSYVDLNILNFLDYKMIFFSFSIILTSFGYNLLIPSLRNYLFNNKNIIIITIFFGSLLPLFIYIFWEFLISNFFFDIGNNLYIQMLLGEGNPTEKLIIIVSNNNSYILFLIFIFSFSAITSSFIGVSLGIYDFFFDFLNISRRINLNKILVLFLVFYVPLIFNYFFRYGFMLALSYAGVFASVLLILFPIYTLWYGRYIKKLKYDYILLDSKLFLYMLFFFGLVIVFSDIVEKILFLTKNI